MGKLKITLIVAACILIPAAIIAYSLGLYKVFAPAYWNAQRQVYENAKPYVHGKVQQLAKYYEEYQKASPSNREAIHNLIIINFADFPADKIANLPLKRFLIAQRGY